MRTLRALWIRLRGLSGLRPPGDEIAAELESHLQMHIDDNLRAGMTPQEARRQALIQLGGMEQTRQAVRERATPKVTLEDGRRALAVATQIVDAIEEHTRRTNLLQLTRAES